MKEVQNDRLSGALYRSENNRLSGALYRSELDAASRSSEDPIEAFVAMMWVIKKHRKVWGIFQRSGIKPDTINSYAYGASRPSMMNAMAVLDELGYELVIKKKGARR